jgi:hypothetical protein
MLERRFRSGVRANVALGLIAAAYAESPFTQARERGAGPANGIWNTVSLGGAIPLSARSSLFGEAALVMQGVQPARDWIGVSPVIAFLGVETSF